MRYFKKHLNIGGFKTCACPDTDTARQSLFSALAEGLPFDLLLTDSRMPDLSGIDFAEELRATPGYERIPIILSSSARLSREENEAATDLIQGVLLKPVRQSALFSTLVSALELAETPVQDEVGDDRAGGVDKNQQGSPLRILVAEDNIMNQIVAKELLINLGHQVELAADGQEALDMARTFPFDLIFMDMHMPVMDGLQSTRAIRALPSANADIPIIALTANVFTEFEQQCMEAGMNGFITKPILHDKLAKYLEGFTTTRST